MTENPYQSPGAARDRYFTDDITLMPTTAIWRICRRHGVVGCCILFPMFAARKLLGWRYAANHATCRVEQLPIIGSDDIPQTTRDALAAFEATCRDCGMDPICLFRAPWIGNKAGVFSIWLQTSGEAYCSIAHIELQLGTFQKAKTVFACHSMLQSGVELHTSPVAPEDWIPELVPPNQDIECLAADTNPIQVIERHRQRIAGRTDVIAHTRNTLLNEIIATSQEQFDFLVAKGTYAPLSATEVERLQSANHRMHGSSGGQRNMESTSTADPL